VSIRETCEAPVLLSTDMVSRWSNFLGIAASLVPASTSGRRVDVLLLSPVDRGSFACVDWPPEPAGWQR
jgi:hypothetical protein